MVADLAFVATQSDQYPVKSSLSPRGARRSRPSVHLGGPEARPGRRLFFSATDIAGAGATKVMLGFGAVPDTVPVGHPPLPPDNSPIGAAIPKKCPISLCDDPDDGDEPSQQGQYGAAIRYLAEGLGGTEFGLYFINYHSRLPLIMAVTGTQAGLLLTGTTRRRQAAA